MNKNNDFMIEITKLSDSDLEKIYQMACQRLKDEKASGKDTSGTEHKLTIISAEMIRRRKKEINDPEKMNPEIKYFPERNYEKIIEPERITEENKGKINEYLPERNKIIGKKHSSNGDEER